MRLRILLLLPLFLSVSLFVPGSSVQAQEIYNWLGGEGDISVSYILTKGGEEGTCTPTYNSGEDRLEGCTPNIDAGVGLDATIGDFPDGTLVNEISFSIDWVSTRPNVSGGRGNAWINVNGETDYEDRIADLHILNNEASGTATITYSGATIDLTELTLSGNVRNYNSSDGSHFYITSIVLSYPDNEYVHPLAPSDRDSWGDYLIMESDSEDITEAIASFSNAPEQFAFSAVSGTVTRVELVWWNECSDIVHGNQDAFFGLGEVSFCGVAVPASTHGGSGGPYFYTLGDNRISVLNSIFQLRMDFYVVEIYSDEEGITFQYLVDDANQYIEVGQTIEAGCILGKSIMMRGITIALNVTPTAEQGVVIVRALDGEGGEIPISELLTIDPIAGNACNVDPEHADCLGDSALERPGDWTTSGQVGWNEPGVTLARNASIRTTMNLEDAREPRIRVGARSFGGSGGMRLRIGQTTQSFQVSQGPIADYEIAGDLHQPDAGIFYSIIIENTGDTSLELDYVCVAFTLNEDYEDENNDPPPNCLFSNNSFSVGLTDWTPNGVVYTAEGELRMDSGQGFSQDVTLHPGDYTVTVTASIWHYNTYELDGTDTTGNVVMEYSFPGGASYSSIETATVADFYDGNNLYEFSANFNIASSENGGFHFRPTLAMMNGAVRGVAIREVCVNPQNGGEFPPDPDEPPPDEPFPEFDENCEAMENPSGENISTWIPWLWHNFSQFFDCTLMILLNDMFDLGNRTYRLIGWNARYWQSTGILGANWLSNQVMPFLGGYLANASGSVYINQSGDSSCEWYDILCHLTNLLDIGGGFFDGLFALMSQYISEILAPITALFIDVVYWILGLFGLIIELVLSVLFLVLIKILELFDLARDILFSIITAYNDAPAESLPGLPDCSANEDNMLCWILFTAEETIFSGTAGGLILPLLTSLIAILMTIHFAAKIKAMLMEASINL